MYLEVLCRDGKVEVSFMKVYGRVDAQLHLSLTSILNGVKWPAPRSALLTHEEWSPAAH